MNKTKTRAGVCFVLMLLALPTISAYTQLTTSSSNNRIDHGNMKVINQAHAHSLFNSQEDIIGNRIVQISTLPEIPTTGEPSQLLFRILDRERNEVDRFTMAVRIFYEGQLVDTIPVKSYTRGHTELNYVFEEHGNHVFKVDLHDAGSRGQVLTYTFNISTLNPFGYIFIFTIASGGIGATVLLLWILFSRRKQAKQNRNDMERDTRRRGWSPFSI